MGLNWLMYNNVLWSDTGRVLGGTTVKACNLNGWCFDLIAKGV